MAQPGRLPKAYHPATGKIQADTKHFGTLLLDEFMQHPQSYAQAFIVVHKGQVPPESSV